MKHFLMLSAAVSLLTPAATAVARQWNDRNGEISVEAEFVIFKDKEVILKKNDGSVIAVPIEKLSYSDYDYLHTLSSESELRDYFRNNIVPTEHTVYITSELPGRCTSIDFSPNGRWLAIGTNGGLLVVDRTKSKIVTKLVEPGFESSIRYCRFAPDGKRLVVGRTSGPIKVWRFDESASLDLLREYTGHSRTVRSMAFGPDGKHVLTGDEGAALRYWNLETAETVHAFKKDILTEDVSACFVNPKGTQAMATDGRFLVLFDLQNGKPVQKMALTNYHHRPCAISPDGSSVAVVYSSDIYHWRTVEGTKLPSLKVPISAGVAAFSPNGKYLVAGTYESAHLWSLPDQELIRRFRTAASFSSATVAFSPDSQYFAVSSGVGDDTLQIFRVPPSD